MVERENRTTSRIISNMSTAIVCSVVDLREFSLLIYVSSFSFGEHHWQKHGRSAMNFWKIEDKIQSIQTQQNFYKSLAAVNTKSALAVHCYK